MNTLGSAGLLLSMTFLGGCATLSVHQGPLTLPEGQSSFAAGVTYLRIEEQSLGSDEVLGKFKVDPVSVPLPFVGFRHGLAGNTDFGVRYCAFSSIEANIKKQIGDSSFAVSPVLGLSLNGETNQILGITPAVIVGNAYAYAAYHPSILLGSKDMLWTQGGAAGLLLGGSRFKINPEFGVVKIKGVDGLNLTPSVGFTLLF